MNRGADPRNPRKAANVGSPRAAVPKGIITSPRVRRPTRLCERIVEHFVSRFAPGARVLVGPCASAKSKAIDTERLEAEVVRVPDPVHLPDIVLHDERRGWLFLITAASPHGLVTSERRLELEQIFASSRLPRVYISAFPSFREFANCAHRIAWGTEAWIADAPTHLVHFNGDRFLDPRAG